MMRALLPKRGVESGDAGPDSVVLRGACGSGRPPPRTRRRRTRQSVASAAALNACGRRRLEPVTPTLGDAFVEEEAEERPDAKAKREAEEAKKEAEKETERANRAAKADADADVSDLSRRLTVAEVASPSARKKAEKGKRHDTDLERRRARSVSARRACFVCFV